jgi:hypothetical protein
MEKKICKKCGIEKPISEYSKNIHMKSGFRNTCKSCSSIVRKIWKQNNPEKVKESRKIWSQNKLKKIRESRELWEQNNPDKVRGGKKKWKEDNIDYIIEKRKKWKENNPDKKKENRKKRVENSINPVNKFCRNCNIELCRDNSYPSAGNACKECEKQRMKDYRKNYPQKRKETKLKNHRTRYNIDDLYKFKSDMRNTVYHSFKRKGYKKNSKACQILGEEWDVVKKYIESQFSEGMTWDNYGEWVFDHKIPISICETIEETIILNHYTNFQPLWAKDNLQKSDKILPEFEHLIDEYLGDIRTRPLVLE